MAVSAPRDEDDEVDSAGSDSHCFELEKTTESTTLKYQGQECQKNHSDEIMKQKEVKKQFGDSQTATGPSHASLQVKFEEQMAEAMPYHESPNQVEDEERITNGRSNPVEMSIQEKLEKCEADQTYESEGSRGVDLNHMIQNLIRNQYLISESGNKQADQDGLPSSIWSQPSPVRHWSEKLPSTDVDASESSSKLHPELKENTLKAKLFEARTRGQRSRSRTRLKSSIISGRKE